MLLKNLNYILFYFVLDIELLKRFPLNNFWTLSLKDLGQKETVDAQISQLVVN